MEYYKDLTESEACHHDVLIAMDRLQSDQEEFFGESPGLFVEEISTLAGWSLNECRAALRYAMARNTVEGVPLVYRGSTSKTSYRLVRKEGTQ